MNLDKTMLGLFCNDTEVGLYTAALKLNRVVLQLILSIGTVVVARLSYYHSRGENEKYQSLFIRVFNYVLLLAVPATVGMCLLSKETLLLMSGSDYLVADSSTKILSLIILIIGMSNLMAVQVFIPMEKEKYALCASSVAAIINFSFNMVLIQKMGKNGAAISTVLAEAVALLICIYFSRKLISYKGVFSNFLQYLCATVFIIPVYYLVNVFVDNYIGILFLTTIFGASIYSIVLLGLRNKALLEILKMNKKFKRSKIIWK